MSNYNTNFQKYVSIKKTSNKKQIDSNTSWLDLYSH